MSENLIHTCPFSQDSAATNLEQMNTSSWGSPPGPNGSEQAEVFRSNSSGADVEENQPLLLIFALMGVSLFLQSAEQYSDVWE